MVHVFKLPSPLNGHIGQKVTLKNLFTYVLTIQHAIKKKLIEINNNM